MPFTDVELRERQRAERDRNLEITLEFAKRATALRAAGELTDTAREMLKLEALYRQGEHKMSYEEYIFDTPHYLPNARQRKSRCLPEYDLEGEEFG